METNNKTKVMKPTNFSNLTELEKARFCYETAIECQKEHPELDWSDIIARATERLNKATAEAQEAPCKAEGFDKELKPLWDTGNKIVNDIVESYLKKETPKPVKEATTGRECYAFALYVNGDFSRFITANCWMTSQQANDYASGMSLAALAFKKTASVCIYKLEDNNVWQCYNSRNSHHNERTIFKIHKSRMNGCSLVKPTEEEQNEFMSLPHWWRLPISEASALPVGWNK